MTYARAHLVDFENGGFYHCTSRCVRRGWLCGEDPVTGRSYEHRKSWIESKVVRLSELFAVNLYGYAIMSNHYHVVLEVVPSRVRRWSDEEVARRWVALTPKRDEGLQARAVEGILRDEKRLEELRKRLSSLSWFMRYINEPVARTANREDGCKGRFWEGRFGSYALLDEGAVLSCMAYVDLNPIRAGLGEGVESAPYTSVKRRVRYGREGRGALASLSGLGLTLRGYVELLEWTVALGRGVERGRGEGAIAHAVGLESQAWLTQVHAHRHYFRAYGSLEQLKRYAERLGQRWIRSSVGNASAPM